MKRCWADILGGCSKKYSTEHYVGRGELFGSERVKTQGLHHDLDGRSIFATDLKAHILCQTHNSNLSDADQEAINLRNALEQFFRKQDKEDLLKGSDLWTPPQYDVSGWLFGRWLCKFHCNCLTFNNVVPPKYYVHYAFGKVIDPLLRFYVRTQFNDILSYQPRIRYLNFPGGPCRDDEYGTFHVFFMGFHFLVCPYDLTKSIQAKLAEISGDQSYLMYWTDQPNKITMENDGIVTNSIVFDWEQPISGERKQNH